MDINGYQAGHVIAVDNNGNGYVTGTFQEQIKFRDDIVLSTLSSDYLGDVFIAKYNGAGEVIWAKAAGGMQVTNPMSLTVDQQGDPYIAGVFHNRAYFGGGSQPVYIIPETGKAYNTFIAKFSQSGNFAWVKIIGQGRSYPAEEYATIKGLASDDTGSIYVTGYHGAAITFSRIGIGDTTLPIKSHFIGKYNPEGNAIWVTGFKALERGPTLTGNFCTGIRVDKSSNVYVSGNFYSSVTFNSGRADELNLYNGSINSEDIAIAKFNSKGNFSWAIKAGSDSYDDCTGLSINDFGKIYIIGPR
jgi:hypothetical protein